MVEGGFELESEDEAVSWSWCCVEAKEMKKLEVGL